MKPKRSISSKQMRKDNDFLIAKALRSAAKVMCENPDAVSPETAKELDRALRACPEISDIDTVWVLWRCCGDSRGWITDKELRYNGKAFAYPAKIYERE